MSWMLLAMFAVAAEPEVYGPPAPVSPTEVSAALAHEDELLAQIRGYDPAIYDRLVALKARDPQEYAAQLARHARVATRYKTDAGFAAHLDRIRDLEAQLRALAARWSVAGPAEKVTIEGQMHALAAELFDYKQAERRAKLDELRLRMDELEREIIDREQRRDQVIDQWVRASLRPR